MADTQLDLFGAVEAAEAARAERQHERAAWEASFTRADWVAPWDTADGHPKGTVYHGWVCPDPACGEVEPGSYLLLINHGWDPQVPGLAPWDGRCQKIKLLEAQAEAARRGR